MTEPARPARPSRPVQPRSAGARAGRGGRGAAPTRSRASAAERARARAVDERKKQIRNASILLGVLAVVMAGVAWWEITQVNQMVTTQERMIDQQAVMGDATPLMLQDGTTTTAGELKAELYMVRSLVTGIDIGLVVFFLVAAIWSIKQPLPAFIAALVVYVLLHLLAAIAQPETIYQGILIKAIVIGGLIVGISNVIKQRGEDARQHARARREAMDADYAADGDYPDDHVPEPQGG